MAEPSFTSRVADRVVGRMGQQADAIVNANPIPPGYDKISSFRDFVAQWRKMPIEQRKEMWGQLDPEMRQRMIDELGVSQIMSDLGAMTAPPEEEAQPGGPPRGMPAPMPAAGPMPGGMPPMPGGMPGGMPPMPGGMPGPGPRPRGPRGMPPMPAAGPMPGGMP